VRVSEAPTDRLDAMLMRLKLAGMRDQLDSLLDEAARANLSTRETLAMLCDSRLLRHRRDPRQMRADGVSRRRQAEDVAVGPAGRLAAARLLGLDEVPVIVLSGLTELQRRQLVLADNRIALNAGWNFEMLSSELKDLAALGADLGKLGFTTGELARALSPSRAGLTDEDEVPAFSHDAVSAAGEIWCAGSHRLCCGDSTDAAAVAALLAGVNPQLMVTDPPYGVDYDPSWRHRMDVNKSRLKAKSATTIKQTGARRQPASRDHDADCQRVRLYTGEPRPPMDGGERRFEAVGPGGPRRRNRELVTSCSRRAARRVWPNEPFTPSRTRRHCIDGQRLADPMPRAGAQQSGWHGLDRTRRGWLWHTRHSGPRAHS
jgi:hypothetical protein